MDATLIGNKGFALRDPLAWDGFASLVREGETLGYSPLFLPEIAGRDSLAALSAIAGETEGIRLATGVIPMNSRSPFLTAMAAATVHERSGGRAILGVGTGGSVKGALQELEGLVRDLRSWLSGGEARGRRLSLLLPSPVPVWVSALGPNAIDLAARVADGVILNWCTPERVRQAREQIGLSATRAGRDPSDVTIAVYVRANVEGGDSPAAALRAAAGEYASYPAYARQFDLMGLGDLAQEAAAAHAAGRTADVPEAFVRSLAITSLDEAGPRLAAFRDAGADLPVVYPVTTGSDAGRSIRSTIESLADA